MGATDVLLTRLTNESEERGKFIDNVVEAAEKEQRDLTSQELELVTRSRERIGELNVQIDPLREASRIARDSYERTAKITEELRKAHPEHARAPEVEYRSAGEYVLDYWKAQLGSDEALDRLQTYNRAAAHQTTADNPGLLPTPIVGPVISFIDSSRPMVTALGPRQLPSGSWSRPKVTQHTAVALQASEKGELTSQKMTITKQAITAATYGGYVNVSRQDIDWTVPAVMDIVIGDLAAIYATTTEAVLGTALIAGATAGTVIPTGAPTAAALSAALWSAAATAYAATKGAGRLVMFIAPDMLAMWGPLFAPVNPSNAQSPGFSAGDFASGLVGSISGIPVYMTNGLAAGGMLVVSTAAAEVYEDRIGSLQVVEPSVLGVQVAYAGYFANAIVEAGGVIKIVKTP